MRVLTACECSGRVRDAFTALGHDAWSADIKPSENGGQHILGDVLPVLDEPWDLVIAFPPCTDLTFVNGANLAPKIEDGRSRAAAKFFLACFTANAPRVCVENPLGLMSRWFRSPDQYVEPWMWGDLYTKRTGLWLRGLPPLIPDVAPPAREPATWEQDALVSIPSDPATAKLPSWHRESKLGVPGDRWGAERSRTFQGIANAMATQWG